MTRTAPRLRMILQFLQIFLTDARTFIFYLLLSNLISGRLCFGQLVCKALDPGPLQ